jgi:hypothetical protein
MPAPGSGCVFPPGISNAPWRCEVAWHAKQPADVTVVFLKAHRRWHCMTAMGAGASIDRTARHIHLVSAAMISCSEADLRKASLGADANGRYRR